MTIEFGAVGALKTVLEFVKSAYVWARGRKAALSNVEIVELRTKWKPVFDEHLALCQRDKLGRDVTVRDIKRLDEYPNIKDEAKGISPWFRAGLVGTNESSILLLLQWMSLNAEAKEFMQLEEIARQDAEGSGNVALIGYVRFEQVVSVNWNGDDYNSRPSLFLHFDARRGEPYSRLALCRRKTMDGPGSQQIEWYSEICDLGVYRDACTKLGIKPIDFNW